MPDKLTFLAKNQRRHSTDAEQLVWHYLRAKKLEGLKFRRQQPIGPYIADFVCFEKNVVIEVDGGQHTVFEKKDRERNRWFEEQGYRVLRFWNHEVLSNIEAVLDAIRRAALNTLPFPLPSREGDKTGSAGPINGS